MNRPPISPRTLGQSYLFAFGGGAGGAGRSTVASEFARLLASRDHRVLFVDAHPTLATAHERLDGSDVVDVVDELLPLHERVIACARGTAHAGLDVVALPWIAPSAAWDDVALEALVASLRRVHYEYVILDLPADASDLSTGLFLASDVPVHLTTTEPASLAAGLAFLRATLRRLLLLAAPPAVAESLEALFEGLPRGWIFEDLFDQATIEGIETHLVQRLHGFESYLLLNQTRDAAERELTPVLALVWYRLVGHRPRSIGAIVHDERRWFHLRQGILSPSLNSDQGMGVQFAETMRRLLAIHEVDEEQPRGPLWPPPDGFAMLGVSPAGHPGDVRATYRRLWEGLRRESTVSRRVLTPSQREELIRELEARNVDVQTRLAEIQSSGGIVETGPVPVPTVSSHPGEDIIRLRQDRRISQRELSLRTKIGARELEAIERFDVDALPRPVYLRGYLQEIAHVLSVDPLPLVGNYLAALEERRRTRILRSR